ncbi:DUF3809 domain-containing protein [Meiothermus sp. QL-1]|uniref:DUF3809 family protein n=1 Tax=Meiothermus sp. QL-1 TaxID=2058095 RepID=UPI000E0BC22E|nr:DUF3809 family protein [Meiothermus sp. QL-1]RDI95083.1 DUF3809 domain-containing protein [Meiothermus sp. QL-1]
MLLEKSFRLFLPEPPEHLYQPERVFSGRPPFRMLRREGFWLEGVLVAEAPLLGEIQFPFRSRIHPEGRVARLEALPLENPPPFWVELAGRGEVVEGGLEYRLTLRLHASLPPGEKWGGRALRRLAEAAFERNLERELKRLAQGA